MAIAVAVLCASIACAGFANAAHDAAIPKQLRGGISVDRDTIRAALGMQYQGWVYVMPKPKSETAGWGNDDPRGTWYLGYWINEATRQTSNRTPRLNHEGDYVGDNKAEAGAWRRGGSPEPPNKIQWLMSKEGGVKPDEDAPTGLPPVDSDSSG
ncbi:MAG: hypothetical protein GC159_13660 [Phycisphaera sp.]|nr:hypothetical protein [Phycisphaera sp.]